MQVATSYANLAGLLRGMNRLVEAIPFARKALDIKAQYLPANHPEAAAAQLWLGDLLTAAAQ